MVFVFPNSRWYQGYLFPSESQLVKLLFTLKAQGEKRDGYG